MPERDSRGATRPLSSSRPARPRRSTTAPGTGWRSPPRPGSAGSPATSQKSSGDIAHVGMIGDWVLTKLSGQFVTDPSLGSSSGMFDLARRDWSDRVLDICGLERKIVPADRRTRHGYRRGNAGRGRGDRLGAGDPGSRRRGRHPARVAGHWADRTPGGSRSWGAASGNRQSCSTNHWSTLTLASAHAVPRHSGAVDDGGHRVL